MISKRRLIAIPLYSLPALVMAGAPAFAMIYLNAEEAQQAIFPGDNFTEVPIHLTIEQEQAIQQKSGVALTSRRQRVWQSAQGNVLIVDQVIGKHDLITYAVGIERNGSIRQVEIMEYRESYGGQVRQKRWRKQFNGKTSASLLELNRDIKNISGATLSCRHVTEGVKQNLSLYELFIKK